MEKAPVVLSSCTGSPILHDQVTYIYLTARVTYIYLTARVTYIYLTARTTYCTSHLVVQPSSWKSFNQAIYLSSVVNCEKYCEFNHTFFCYIFRYVPTNLPNSLRWNEPYLSLTFLGRQFFLKWAITRFFIFFKMICRQMFEVFSMMAWI